MKKPIDLARRYLALADRDIQTFIRLADDPDIDDEPIGFHAQQAVEKCLKALLVKHQIEFRKTHDLGELIGLLKSAHLPLPPSHEDLLILNPFAVLFRYDFIGEEKIDRDQVRKLIASLRKWMDMQIE